MGYGLWKRKTGYDQNSNYLSVEDAQYSGAAIKTREYGDGRLYSKLKAIARGFQIRNDLGASNSGEEASKLYPGPWN